MSPHAVVSLPPPYCAESVWWKMTPQLLIPNAPAAITEQRQHISVTSTVKPVKNNVFVPILSVRELNMLLFSSHPPLIFSSILLFRSLLLTNKLKQHAFVHFHRKTSCSGLLRVGLSISTIISKLFKHPWQLPPLLTPWRRFDTHRFEPTAFFFFYTFLQKVWLPGFQITFYPYLLIILCSLQFYLGKYARTARHSRPCQL